MNIQTTHNTLPVRNYIGGVNATQLKTYDRISAAAYIYVCCVNDITDSAVRDALALVRQNKRLYRQQVKKACKDYDRVFGEYEKILDNTLTNRFAFWLDLSMAYADIMAKHVGMLRLSLMQLLTRRGIHYEDRELVSRIMTAGTMLAVAVQNHELYFQVNAEKYGMNLAADFRKANMKAAQRHFGVVSDAVLAPYGDELMQAFHDDKQCALAIRCVEEQMLSFENVNRAGLEALKVNPDCVPEGVDVNDLKVIDGIIVDPGNGNRKI